MTQRIFDVLNKQDVNDLFDLFSDNVVKIGVFGKGIALYTRDFIQIGTLGELAINWHGKTEITRPVDESKWIGCLCFFWNEFDMYRVLGILDRISSNRYYFGHSGNSYKYCRLAKRSEIKFVEDGE